MNFVRKFSLTNYGSELGGKARKRKASRKTCFFFFNEIRLWRVKYADAYEIASL